MRPDAFLGVARTLLHRHGDDEAHRRAAIHAAYYAVFHLLAPKVGLDPQDRARSAHLRLLERVSAARSGDDPVLKVAGRTLQALRKWRSIADYRLDQEVDVETARRTVGYAEAIFAAA
jgi:uncharacterized protein (UPF0332 family)